MTKKTFYDVLQVSPNADQEIIKAAYRSLVQRFHPDRNPDNPDADQYLKIINRAYVVLSDPVKREGYDAALKDADESQENQADSAPYAKTAAANKNNASGATGGRTQAASENEKNVPRPWIRFWARNIDYLVVGVIVSYAIFHFGQGGEISEQTLLWLENPFVYSTLIIGSWAIVEPVVIAEYGTTIGKSILRVRLSHKQSTPRRSLDVWQLYQRSMNVWLRGLGIGLPFVSMITQLVGYRNLKSRGETSWDRDGGYTVTHGKVGYVRGGFATIFILFAVTLSVMLNGHENRAASPQSQQPSAGNIDDQIEPPGGTSPQRLQSATQHELKPYEKRAWSGNRLDQFNSVEDIERQAREHDPRFNDPRAWGAVVAWQLVNMDWGSAANVALYIAVDTVLDGFKENKGVCRPGDVGTVDAAWASKDVPIGSKFAVEKCDY